MVSTLTELFLNTLKNYSKDEFMLCKKGGQFVPISTAVFAEKVRYLCLGLYSLGFRKGDKLSILSENRPEWTMMDFAALFAGGLVVPIYTTLVSEQIHYMIDDSDTRVVVVSNPVLWKKIEPLRPVLNKVSTYVVLDGSAPEGAMTFDQLIEMGRALGTEKPGLFDELAVLPKPDDEATLIYTSGTTGQPKGTILTHANFVSNVQAVLGVMEVYPTDIVLSFLPLSHVLERMVLFCYIQAGTTIAFAENIEAVAKNLIEVRPVIMVSVPRVFEKIYAKVMDQILTSPPLQRRIFFWAIKIGRKGAEAELVGKKLPPMLALKLAVARKLVFSKITARTGGRVRFFISGGAPLARDISEFFYVIGLVIYEGYGLTETSPVLALNTKEDLKLGTVGKPLPGVEIKIADDGEILARGPNVMKGYYKKEAATREALAGGWFHTGDIGCLDDDGFLAITDRKKDLIVTSGGKNVAPQPIENLLKTNPYITNIVIIGDRRRFVSALVVPDFEKLGEYARSHGISYSGNEGLVADNRIVEFIKSEIDRATPQLASYERIKKIRVLSREFEIESGEMTPTLKVRRTNIEERYKGLIDEMYNEEAPPHSESNGN